jgi:hypothetical protein
VGGVSGGIKKKYELKDQLLLENGHLAKNGLLYCKANCLVGAAHPHLMFHQKIILAARSEPRPANSEWGVLAGT